MFNLRRSAEARRSLEAQARRHSIEEEWVSDQPLASAQDLEIPFGLRHDSEIGAGIMHQAVDRASNSRQLRGPTDAAMSLAMELGFDIDDAEDGGEGSAEPGEDEQQDQEQGDDVLGDEASEGLAQSDAGEPAVGHSCRPSDSGADEGHAPALQQRPTRQPPPAPQAPLATGGGDASEAGLPHEGISSVAATDVESDLAEGPMPSAAAGPGPASAPFPPSAAAAAAGGVAGGGGADRGGRMGRSRAGTGTGHEDTGGSSNFEAAFSSGVPVSLGIGGGLTAELAAVGPRGGMGSGTGVGGRAMASSAAPSSPRHSLMLRTSAAPLPHHLQHPPQAHHVHAPSRSNRWSAHGPSPHVSGLLPASSAAPHSQQQSASLAMQRNVARGRGQSDGGESGLASPPRPSQPSPGQRSSTLPPSPPQQQQNQPAALQPLPRAVSVLTNVTSHGTGMRRGDTSSALDTGGGGCCQGTRTWWQDVRLQTKLLWKVFLDIVARKPWVLLVPLLMCCLFTGLGVFGVLYASDRNINAQQNYAREAVASATANAISGQLEIATFAVMTMSAYLTQQPFCADLNRTFNNLSSVILDWDEKQLVYQVQALPAAVLNYIYPPLNNPELEEVLIGRDLLEVPMYREDTLYQIRSRDQRLMLGPYALLEGFQGIFVTYPIFLPAPSATFDWGCGVQPHDCPPGVCWLPAEGLKLWGLATSVVSLDNMQADFRFATLSSQGYLYRLHQLPRTPNRAAIIATSDPPPSDPVIATVVKFNLVWVLEVSPASGWVPAWRDPCIAAVVVGSCLVSLLVLWLLVTREKHNMLLQAMLPEKVIWRLQRGEQTVVEEFLEPVTILFSDIVSYTEVASQLTPLQVVRLLNELYTQFDLLCDKHEVYKVETIGDAFMAVAGCPTREEPIAAAIRMANMAQDMIAMVDKFTTRVGDEEMKVKIRIGLHSGPVVAGVIGQRMPRYCLFGDTVNTASRMETNSSPMCIHISAVTASLLRLAGAKVVMPPRPAKRATSDRHNAPASPLRMGLPTLGGPPSALSLLGGVLGGLPSGVGPGLPSDAAGGPPPSPPNLSLLLEQHDQQLSNGDMWHLGGLPAGGGVVGLSGPAPTAQASRQSLINLSDTAFSAGAAGVASGAAGVQPHVPAAGPSSKHQTQHQPSGAAAVNPSPASRLWGGGAGAGRNVLPMLDKPMTLYGRGRTMIKGKGMMHTFWLQRRPEAPPAPAVPPAPAAAARTLPPPGVAAARSRRPSAQRPSPFHPSNGPAGVTPAEAVNVLGMASFASQTAANNASSCAAAGGVLGVAGAAASCRPSETGGSTSTFVRRITNMTNGGGLTPPSLTPAASGAGGYTGGYGAYAATATAAAAATAAATATAAVVVAAAAADGMDCAGGAAVTTAQLPQSGLQAAIISAAVVGHHTGVQSGTQCPSPLGRNRGVTVHSYTSPSLPLPLSPRPRLQSAHAPLAAGDGRVQPALPHGTVTSVLAAAVALGPPASSPRQQPAATAGGGAAAGAAGLLGATGTSSVTSIDDVAFPITFDPPIADARNHIRSYTSASSLTAAAAAAAAFSSGAAASSAGPLGVASPGSRTARQDLLGAAICDVSASGECELAAAGGSVSRGGTAAGHSSSNLGSLRLQRQQQAYSAVGGGDSGIRNDEAPPLALGLDSLAGLAEAAGVATDMNATFGHSTARLNSSTVIPPLCSAAAIAGNSDSGLQGFPIGAGASNTSAGQFSFGLAGVSPGSVGPPFQRRQRLLAGLESVISAAGADVDSTENGPAAFVDADGGGDGCGGSATLALVGGRAPRTYAHTAGSMDSAAVEQADQAMPGVDGDGSAAFHRGSKGIGEGGSANGNDNANGNGNGGVSISGAAALPATRAGAALSGPTDMIVVAQTDAELRPASASAKAAESSDSR